MFDEFNLHTLWLRRARGGWIVLQLAISLSINNFWNLLRAQLPPESYVHSHLLALDVRSRSWHSLSGYSHRVVERKVKWCEQKVTRNKHKSLRPRQLWHILNAVLNYVNVLTVSALSSNIKGTQKLFHFHQNDSLSATIVHQASDGWLKECLPL